MDIKFQVVDDDEQTYGTFKTLEDAYEEALENAIEFEKDMFIKKITTKIVKCVIPE